MSHTLRLRLAALALSSVSLALPLRAQRLTNRAELAQLLGTSAVTEDFEDAVVGASYVVGVGQLPRLDASTNVPAAPTGTIAPGLAFTNGNNAHYFFQPTAETAYFGSARSSTAPARRATTCGC